MAIIKLNYLSKHFIYYMVSLVIKMIGFMVPVFKDLRVKEDYVS